MITVLRVDHRLLHGQVAFSWIKSTSSDCILISCDDVAGDHLRMSALRMAKPDGVKLVMKNVEDSIAAINSGVTDKYRLFVIADSVDTACRLIKGTKGITELQLGGVKTEEGKRAVAKAVFLSDEELAKIAELTADGVRCYAQMIPEEVVTELTGNE